MNQEMHEFIENCCTRQLSLSLAESMTCGLAAHQLSNSPGTSKMFKGAVVCYSEDVKTRLLKVPASLIKKHTAESMQVTIALARGLNKVIPADICASITGLASADGTESREKPTGTVFFCVLYRKRIYKLRKVFRGTPLQVRKKATKALYDFISRKVFSQKI